MFTRSQQHPHKHDRKRVSPILILIFDIDEEFNRAGWLCNGEVLSEVSYFIHEPPPFLFVDVIHPIIDDSNSDGIVQVDLNIHDMQHNISVGSSQ